MEDGKKKVLGMKSFAYDLGGVRTGQKIQGATTPRLTCNFNPRPKGVRTNLNLRSFLVAISRVKSIDHFRIVPMIDGDRLKLGYMKNFSMDPKLRILPMCYNENGDWIATPEDIIRWFDENDIPWRPKATNKHPLTERELDILRQYPKMPSIADLIVPEISEVIELSSTTRSSNLQASANEESNDMVEIEDLDQPQLLTPNAKRSVVGCISSDDHQRKKQKSASIIQGSTASSVLGKKRKTSEITSLHKRTGSSPTIQSTKQTPCHGLDSNQTGLRINYSLDDFEDENCN
jgi:hypothetical protein